MDTNKAAVVTREDTSNREATAINKADTNSQEYIKIEALIVVIGVASNREIGIGVFKEPAGKTPDIKTENTFLVIVVRTFLKSFYEGFVIFL